MRLGLFLLLLSLALLNVHAVEAATAPDVPLTDQTKLRFATVEQGRAALVRDDAFVRNLSRFDLESRLQRTEAPTREAWKGFVSEQVRPWEGEEAERVTASIERLRGKLAALQLPLPEQVLLIHTSGKEEGHAAYCRGAAIVLPDKVLAYDAPKLDKLLTHELFHVLSNQNPELRAKLYKIIGFHGMPEMELPATLRDRKITNPDAPAIDCWIEVESQGKPVKASPILYASAERFDPASKRTFFEYLTFRLLVLAEADGKLSPLLADGKPVLLDPKELPTFFTQIGKNTQYIIHPDEVLADNFMHLVHATPNLATPSVVERLREALKK